MLAILSPFVSAFIATYAASRILWRLFGALSGWPRLLATHAASLALLGIGIGLLKAYFVSFAANQAFGLILPQLFWLLVDLARGKAAAR